MKIACEACGAKYTIADDKVRGRKVKIRCKSCGTPIVVDGQGGGPNASDAETDAALELADAPAVWSVNLSDTDSRTMSVEEIVAGYAAGLVTADAFVWKDGMADWVAVLESELAPLLQGAPTPVASDSTSLGGAGVALTPAVGAPLAGASESNGQRSGPHFAQPNAVSAPAATASRPTAARPAAARVQTQPTNTQDLFGAINVAGSDDDQVATSAPSIPQAGSSAYDDGKMTGARNENSVLFSLDALKAGFAPSASATPSAAKSAPKASKTAPGSRPQQPSNPDDPFGMGTSSGLLGMGGVLFGGDNQALLTAPAAPPPPVPAQAVSGAQPSPYARPQRNKLILILGSVGGVAIIGLLLALLLVNRHGAAPGTDGSALGIASAAPSAASDNSALEAKKADEPPKTNEKPAESASASASASPTAGALLTAKPVDKPVAVAMKSEPPKKPKDEPAPAVDSPPFSKASAISALSAAASSANSCKKPGGPTGSGKATITFAPSGRVTTATVSGSFAGTSVGGCVASVFRRAHVPAFSGSSVTVSKSFNIN